MIKINGYEDSSAFVEEYLQDKILKIEKNLNKMNLIEKNCFMDLFPEAFFDGKTQNIFFEDLLSKNLYDIFNKYPSVKKYFEIVFFASLDIKNICKNGSDNAEKLRNQYFNRFKKYCKCNELDYVIEEFKNTVNTSDDIESYICKYENNFVQFQKYINDTYVRGKTTNLNKKSYVFLDKITK